MQAMDAETQRGFWMRMKMRMKEFRIADCGNEKRKREVSGKVEPKTEVPVKGSDIGGSESPHHAPDELGLHGRQLALHAAGHGQARSLPIAQGKIHLIQPGSDGNDEQITLPAAVADDHGGPDLQAREIGKGNRQEDDVIS